MLVLLVAAATILTVNAWSACIVFVKLLFDMANLLCFVNVSSTNCPLKVFFQTNMPSAHRHLSNIDWWMTRTAGLVCLISTLNGCIKKEKRRRSLPWKTDASSRHITNLKQSIFFFRYLCFSILLFLDIYGHNLFKSSGKDWLVWKCLSVTNDQWGQ